MSLATINQAARAWFTEAEGYRVDTVLHQHTFSHLLRVQHRATGICVDIMIDEDIMDAAQDSHGFLENTFQSIEDKIYYELVIRGEGTMVTSFSGFNPSRDAVLSLLQLMKLGLLAGEDGTYWVISIGKWGEKIAAPMLDMPLSWWQNFVKELLEKNHGLIA